jgi:hypothetical protein
MQMPCSVLEQTAAGYVSGASWTQESFHMREPSRPFSVIFDPISKSALIHFGDRVTWLSGPFANYQEALSAAGRSLSKG